MLLVLLVHLERLNPRLLAMALEPDRKVIHLLSLPLTLFSKKDERAGKKHTSYLPKHNQYLEEATYRSRYVRFPIPRISDVE
jgi:hypothetical protein|uniref:Uncharacterized protein n=1 Tax=Picea glauca TaxID=3330 RepID=A0A117NIX7_PICGL|nr:hypothetical protein ABT39_MTgene492 [Picea glauca]QHR91374.1 hypothetical protein Q903MT_gene5408 [Picea sitchensis]